MLADLRYAFRSLTRSPGFSAVAIVTLALGIGVNTTVFSILEALVLRPLPIADPGRVALIESNRSNQISIPDYRDLARASRAFDSLAAYRVTSMALDRGAGAEYVWGYLATGSYFELLGITPAVGRFFSEREDAVRGGSPYAVISYDFWRSSFDGNPAIGGTTIRINGLPYTVLGVAPEGFHGTEVFYRASIWVPMSMQPQVEGNSWLDVRISQNSLALGRLKPGVTTDQAAADANITARAIAAAEPATHEGFRFRLGTPGLMGSTGRGPVSAFMTGVLALASLVLLAACANLASLLASRVIDRAREISIRLSLGATTARIARLVVAETALLASLGGAAGFAVALGALSLLSAWRLPLPVPIQFTVTPDPWVVLFAAVVTMIVALLSSLAPARHVWRTDPARLTGANATPAIGRRWSVRDAMLCLQVAFCCLVLMAAVVAGRGLVASLSTPLGIAPAGLSVVSTDLAVRGYDGRTGTRFKERLLEEMAALPGITAVAMANALPLTPAQNNSDAYPDDGSPMRPSNAVRAGLYQVSPGYFAVAGTRLIAGRDFAATDRINTPAVAVVNTEFARRVMGTTEAVGRRFRQFNQLVEVVGVVETGKYLALGEAPKPTVFRPMHQSYNSSLTVLARSNVDPRAAAALIGRTVQRLDPGLPLQSQQGGNPIVAWAFLPSQIAFVALGTFGLLAAVLAVAGVYGLAAYSVSARIRDLGIRIAIGASRRQLLQSVLGRTAVLLACGSIMGIAVGTATQGVLGAVVYQASARDPLLVGAIAGAMLLIGLAAAWTPARRALRIDPATVLRG